MEMPECHTYTLYGIRIGVPAIQCLLSQLDLTNVRVFAFHLLDICTAASPYRPFYLEYAHRTHHTVAVAKTRFRSTHLKRHIQNAYRRTLRTKAANQKHRAQFVQRDRISIKITNVLYSYLRVLYLLEIYSQLFFLLRSFDELLLTTNSFNHIFSSLLCLIDGFRCMRACDVSASLSESSSQSVLELLSALNGTRKKLANRWFLCGVCACECAVARSWYRARHWLTHTQTQSSESVGQLYKSSAPWVDGQQFISELVCANIQL